MVQNSIPTKPNKYWPGVVALGLVGLFVFLSITNKKHDTTSGDNIHRFSNGGRYEDGNKRITYNSNSPYAYDGSSSNNTFVKLSMLGLSLVWVAFCGIMSITGVWKQSGCEHNGH